MAEDASRVVANEAVVPLLPCTAADETLEFWRGLGFEVTWEQRKPYLYLAVAWSGFELHYGAAGSGVDPSEETTGGCLVMVDPVAPYHAALVAEMRSTWGKVLSRGRPRITRFRPGASRFTVVDPSGNSIIVIARDEPRELAYGGSRGLEGLARALDNARVLREFKLDDRAAYRALTSGVRRHAAGASAEDLRRALTELVELAGELDEPDHAAQWAARLSVEEPTGG